MAKKKKGSRKGTRREATWLANQLERMTEPWRLAVFTLREQLSKEALTPASAERRFQNDRLLSNFMKEIAGTSSKAKLLLSSYWLFCGSPWQEELGYNEAREQHSAELRALRLPFDFQPKGDDAAIVDELLFRMHSLSSWLEAHESWLIWRMLDHQPAAWDGKDSRARKQAMDAGFIARMPIITKAISDRAIADVIRSFENWSDIQWRTVIKSASNLVSKVKQPPSVLENWMWWRFPIFARYRWSASEVCRAGIARFGELDQFHNVAAFQSSWVRRGLRFSGKRGRRKMPPLWDFVLNVPPPTALPSSYSMLTWIPYENTELKP